MPFTRITKNKYRSQSGRTYTAKQVRAYYASEGWRKKLKRAKKKKRKK